MHNDGSLLVIAMDSTSMDLQLKPWVQAATTISLHSLKRSRGPITATSTIQDIKDWLEAAEGIPAAQQNMKNASIIQNFLKKNGRLLILCNGIASSILQQVNRKH